MDATRRGFIAGVAAAGLSAEVLAAGKADANIRKGKLVTDGRKINVACVGCGGKGNEDIRGVSGENIVALCDVDFSRGGANINAHPEARLFRDWRDMLATMDDQLDAVVITTPDHMHFPIAMMAMKMGKHVYVQKPLAHTVAEARVMLETARRHEVCTQMGNQGHSNEGTRRLREWIEAGVIGEVKEVHLWTNRPVWPQNMELPTEAQNPPKTLDWNRWLGVAQWRPYNKAYLPFNWRGWWEYGTGAIGDMGCHTMDASFWALKLGSPTKVSAEVVGGNEYSCPKGSIITYEFPARGKLPPVTVKWFDGCCKPPRPAALEENVDMSGSGQLYFGTKGTIMDRNDYCDNPQLIPRAAMKAAKAENLLPAPTLERIKGGHYQNWLDAIRGKIPAASSNFEHACPLTEMALLGAIAVRARCSFNWDPVKMVCDNPAAQRYVDKTYRQF